MALFQQLQQESGKSVNDKSTLNSNEYITVSLETMKIVNNLPKLDID